MTSALIGSTGFVGGSIASQNQFTDYFHSKNIHGIRNKRYDLVVCAGAPGRKWEANQHPEEDLGSINNLIDNLSYVKTNHFVLISTIDVYPKPLFVDETSTIHESQLQPYGRHRYMLEKFVASTFPKHTIVRLPALFGPGLKKNFIFDLMHGANLHLTNSESVFQFYDIRGIWKDIQIAVNNSIPLINFATEPIQVNELVQYVLGQDFSNSTGAPPLTYDFHTIYGKFYNTPTKYIYSREDTLKRLKTFIQGATL